MRKTKEFDNVTFNIVPADVCVGCGICAGACPHHTLDMQLNIVGENLPVVVDYCSDSCTICLDVCPFDDHEVDEDILSLKYYKNIDYKKNQTEEPHNVAPDEDDGVKYLEYLGYYVETYQGYAVNQADRTQSSSGGIATLFLKELLATGEVDAVVAPVPTNSGSPWYEMAIMDSPEQIDQGRGSIYSTVHMGDIIREIAYGEEKTYAVMALPCFAKAIRLTQEMMPRVRRRVKYIVGMVCGGYYSLQFPEMLTALTGEENPTHIRYRTKHKQMTANDFSFSTHKKEGAVPDHFSHFQSFFGFLYMNKFASLRSCSFCDDTFAELADLVVMDAWLPEYIRDTRGTTFIVCRNKDVQRILLNAKEKGLWEGSTISAERVMASQQAVVDQKVKPLRLRNKVAREKGFTPRKRYEKHESTMPLDPEQLRIVEQELEVLDEMKQLFVEKKKQWQRKRGIFLSLAARLFCIEFFFKLRRRGIPIVRGKLAWGIGRIPHPRRIPGLILKKLRG